MEGIILELHRIIQHRIPYYLKIFCKKSTVNDCRIIRCWQERQAAIVVTKVVCPGVQILEEYLKTHS
jgi:hypothetical protein